MADSKTNLALLERKIKDSGYKKEFIAGQCGITYQAFRNRLKGAVEFRTNEVRAIKRVLSLTDLETTKIFYS